MNKKWIYFIAPIFLILTENVYSQVSVIEQCAKMANSALRSYSTYKNDKAFLAVSYADHCSVDKSYSNLSSSQQASFSAAYTRIARLGYGSSGQKSTEQETYKSFCSKSASLFKADQELYNELSTIRDRALKTVELCLVSAQVRVKVNYSTPEKPQDLVTVVFSVPEGSQKLLGVGGRNITCKSGDQEISPQLAKPLDITSNAINVTCSRRAEPINIYGINGKLYPRAQIIFYTNYSDQPLEILLPEGVTGPLDERLAKIESKLTLDTVQEGSVVAFRNGAGCPANGWEPYKNAEGRTIIGVSSTYSLESKAGESTHTLTIREMPAHNHSTYTSNESGRTAEHGQVNPELMHIDESQVTRATGGRGNSEAHNNMQPYVALHYCVKT
jgi:hypothetical protein